MFVNHVCQNLFSCSLTRLYSLLDFKKKESSLQSNDTTIEKLVDKSNKKTKFPKFNIFSSNDTTLRSLSKSLSTIIKHIKHMVKQWFKQQFNQWLNQQLDQLDQWQVIFLLSVIICFYYLNVFIIYFLLGKRNINNTPFHSSSGST